MPARAAIAGRGGRSAVRRFLRDERGAITLEFTVLVPFFVLLLVFFADATVIYLTHTEMYGTARDIARRVSTGELADLAAVEAYANDRLHLGTRTYDVAVDVTDEAVVVLSIGIQDAAIFGYFFRPILGRQLTAVAATGEEPRIE